MRFLILFAVSVFFASIVKAQTAILYNYEGTFDDATFSVEGAILDKGLVIDHISHTGDMLSRTANDVGSDIEIFKSADIFLFCSAAISRKVMEANPLNIAHCPYNIFVFENDNGVHIGHRSYPDGPMQMVHELLTDIISQALDF